MDWIIKIGQYLLYAIRNLTVCMNICFGVVNILFLCIVNNYYIGTVILSCWNPLHISLSVFFNLLFIRNIQYRPSNCTKVRSRRGFGASFGPERSFLLRIEPLETRPYPPSLAWWQSFQYQWARPRWPSPSGCLPWKSWPCRSFFLARLPAIFFPASWSSLSCCDSW